ncbi:MAG: hypothetical protein WBA06_12785 [Candidatus Aquilonibacter sp.]
MTWSVSSWVSARSDWARWLLLVPLVALQLAIGLGLAIFASLLNLNGPIQEGLFGASFLWAIGSATVVAPSNKTLAAGVLTSAAILSTTVIWSGLLTEKLNPSWGFFAFALSIGSLLCLWYFGNLVWRNFCLARDEKRITEGPPEIQSLDFDG